MGMYAIALIHQLEESEVKQVWFADDATAGGNLVNLKEWWEHIIQLGPNYGYHPNASKTWLIVKEGHLEEARAIFEGTGVAITTEGKRHLGAAIGTSNFVESYVQQKVSEWVHEMETSATRSLCCSNTWSVQQVDIPGQDHSKHRRPFQTIGRCYPSEILAFPHSPKCF